MALEPSLWRTLPEELLHLVFARLPVAGIGQLRVLSKAWKKNVDCKDSEFNYVLDETNNLNMFALLPWRFASELGSIYDVQANKWHVYKTDAIFEKFSYSLDAADGGLVCILSKWSWSDNEPGFCYVINPLTKQVRKLPSLLCMEAKKSNTCLKMARMLKLTMDKKTKEYKVFVLSSIGNSSGGFFAQVYDSCIKEWTVMEATQGHIIGWDDIRLCVYNFADRTLQYFNRTDFVPELKDEQGYCNYVLLEDHLFVLHKEVFLGREDPLEDGASVLVKYCISEFHLSQNTTTWVKLGVHSCSPCKLSFDVTSFYTSILLGCKGFLLIHSGHSSQSSWLYNLSTSEWRSLPAFQRPLSLSMMCTISWSAIA